MKLLGAGIPIDLPTPYFAVLGNPSWVGRGAWRGVWWRFVPHPGHDGLPKTAKYGAGKSPGRQESSEEGLQFGEHAGLPQALGRFETTKITVKDCKHQLRVRTFI